LLFEHWIQIWTFECRPVQDGALSAPSTRRRFLVTLLGSAVLACTANRIAAAEELFVVLDYDLAPGLVGCPTALDFRRDVKQSLGYDPFRENAGKRVVVRVDATAHGLEGRVDWQGAHGNWEGERKFSHRRDCAELAQAMTFAITVQIQLLATTLRRPATAAPIPRAPLVADSVLEKPPPPPTTAPEMSKPAMARQLVESQVRPSVPSRQRSFVLGLGLGPSAGFGLAPGPSIEGRLFATLRSGQASVELGAEASWPSTLRQSDGSGFSQYRLALTIAGCGHRDRWSACLLGEIGQMRVRGFGVDVPSSASGVTALTGLRLAMTQRVTERSYIVARADVLGRLTPWTVTLNQADVWTMPRFAVAVGIDFAFRFH
jgi:hypothetical protein